MSRIEGILFSPKLVVDHIAAVDHHSFHKRVAHAHNDAAVDLALMHQRVQNRSGAVRAREMREFDLPGFHIDIDFGDLDTKRRCRARFEILIKAMAANF